MSKPKILWLGVFSDHVKEMMRKNAPADYEILFVQSKTDREEHLRALAQADYISPNGIKLTKEYIEAAPNLKLIQLWGAGIDDYDLDWLKKRNIALQNGVGFNAPAVAEMAILHMLAVNRHLIYVDRTLRTGKWIKSEMRDRCNSLYGKSVGLVGMGNIGRIMSRYLHGLDVGKVLYYDIRRMSCQQEEELNVEFCELDSLICQSDIISLHLPLNDKTRKLIDRRRIAMMKPTAVLINTARGGIVDEEALVEALQEHRIRGAGLDSYSPEPPAADNPLFRLDNVVLTPHTGGAVVENVEPRIRHVYDCISKFERGEAIDPKYVILTRS